MARKVFTKADAGGHFNHQLTMSRVVGFLFHAPVGVVAGVLPFVAAMEFDMEHVIASCVVSFMMMLSFISYQVYEGIRIRDFSFIEIGEAVTGLWMGATIMLVIMLFML